MELTWKIDDKPVEQESVFETIESRVDEVAPDEATDILEGIKASIEDHLKENGYSSAVVDKNMWIVDVEYDGEEPGQVPALDGDTGAYMDPPMFYTVSFQFKSAMGGRRRRRRGKKSRRVTRRRR